MNDSSNMNDVAWANLAIRDAIKWREAEMDRVAVSRTGNNDSPAKRDEYSDHLDHIILYKKLLSRGEGA
jgi:hypothetical protein